MVVQKMDYVKVFMAGVVFMVPYKAVQTAVNDLAGVEVCGPDANCIYQKSFADGTLPRSGWWYFTVTNGRMNDNVNSGSQWLLHHNVSPTCESMTQQAMESQCRQLPASNIANPVSAGSCLTAFEIALLLWGISRIVHDWAVLAGAGHGNTLTLSFLSIVALLVCTVSSIMMAWSALEPMYAPVGGNCGCYFRFGFYAAAAIMATPISFSLHLIGKVENWMRAFLGGDYLLTQKFHVAHHLLESRGLPATGSVLGVSGLGSASFAKPELTNMKTPINIWLWLTLVAMMASWAGPLPLFLMRAAQLITGHTVILPILILSVVLIVVMSLSSCFGCGCPQTNFAKPFNMVSKFTSLAFIIFPAGYKGNWAAALRACPELAEEERLTEYLDAIGCERCKPGFHAAMASVQLRAPLLQA